MQKKYYKNDKNFNIIFPPLLLTIDLGKILYLFIILIIISAGKLS